MLNGANRFDLGRSGWWVIGHGVGEQVVACSESHLNIAIAERRQRQVVTSPANDEMVYA
jgi:hypothetical protein